MPSFASLCFVLTVFGIGYQFFALTAALRFFRRAARWTRLDDHTPPVTVMKPLRGSGVELYANLESFCRQDYPAYQIVFGVAEPDDPAVDIVRRLQRAFPNRDLVLSVGTRTAANGKIGNLLQMMEHAAHDLLVLSDADVRVEPEYLRTMVRPLQEPSVGLSTCLYRARGTVGLATALESLFVNTDFVPMTLIGNWLGIRSAYGASIAIKRAVLDAIGGLEVVADQLADDYVLGQRAMAAGYELAVLPYMVETILDAVTLREVWRHQIRWARTYRTVQPLGWFMAIVTHLTTWAVLFWLATGGTPLAQWTLLAALGARLLGLGVLMFRLRERETARQFWLLPAKDLAVTAIWMASWLGRDVEWGGRRFRVEPDGRLVMRPARSCPAPPLAAPSP
jgi:ceramide glucosyltransferase